MPTFTLRLLAGAVSAAVLIATPGVRAADHPLHFLQPGDVVPTRVLPPPPVKGSDIEKAELVDLHAIVASASPERLARAKWDDEHEDPALFDAALGVKLESLPKTWALLKSVQNEGDAAADVSKVYFSRSRPWAVDPTLANCDAGKNANPLRSYPSGHSTLGYSVGFVLAQLLPDKATTILTRAADFAMSRKVCGVHFPSDTEASHVLGTIVAVKLLANPTFAAKLPAVRAELRAAHLAS